MALNDITNITNENIPPGVNTKEDPTPAAPATTTTTTATTTSTPASAVANMTVPLHSANAELKNKDKERQRSDSAVTSSTQGGGNAAKGLEHLENFTCKHPLMNEWTLWFTKPPTGRVRKGKKEKKEGREARGFSGLVLFVYLFWMASD